MHRRVCLAASRSGPAISGATSIRMNWAARTPRRLELTGLQTAADLARMIAEGIFPYPESRDQQDNSPRVGDGVIRLDADGAVLYASPNALSAYRRFSCVKNSSANWRR